MGLFEGINIGLSAGLVHLGDGTAIGMYSNDDITQYDIDALLFFRVAGIVSKQQQKAVNYLVKAFKAANLWSGAKAIYPIVGGTSSSHKWNLKDLKDTDASYRLTFSGTWTHRLTGMKGDGSSAYADTFIVPSSDLVLDDTTISVYTRNGETASSPYVIGSYDGETQCLAIRTFGSVDNGARYYSYNSQTVTTTSAASIGCFSCGRNAAAGTGLYRNGILIASRLDGGTRPTRKITLGAVNVSGTPSSFSIAEISFSHIGAGLTQEQHFYLNQIVSTYQVLLGRNVI